MTGDDESLQIEQVIVRLIAGHPFVSAPGLGCVRATPAATARDFGVVQSIEQERVRPEAMLVSVTVDPERARADHGR